MIIPTLRFAILCISILCWIIVLPGRRGVIGTTLTTPLRLLDLGLFCWIFSLALGVLPRMPPGAIDLCRYFSTLLILGAGISVLGARNPGGQAWTGFVVVPMFLVLGWPVLLCWGDDWLPDRLELMTPAFLGILLVIVMGGGNYLTTRWQSASLFGAASLSLSSLERTALLPTSGILPTVTLLSSDIAGLAALFCILVGTNSGASTHNTGLVRFWGDFRDHFGIVWSYRVMERLNQEAERLKWPFRFEIDRIVLAGVPSGEPMLPAQLSPTELPQKTVDEIRLTLEWMFRRFVSDAWRNSRLGPEWTTLPERTEP